MTAAEAAALVPSSSWIDYGTSLVQPDVFDKALAARMGELKDVKIRSCLTVRPRATIEGDPWAEHFHFFNWHFSGYDRKLHDRGLCTYMPLNLGEVPDYYRRFLDPVDVAIFKVAPPDELGIMNFSACNLWHRAVAERAKKVIVEINENQPYMHGDMNGLHVCEVDGIIEGDHAGPAELPNPPPSAIDRAVARHITAAIGDGDCLQIGIGGMPNAVCALLLESGAKDLGIHTEMLTDGLVALYKAGRVTGNRKTLDRNKVTYSFGLGSKDMYETAKRNRDFHCCPVDYTNRRISSCRTTRSCRSTTPPRSTCRARPRRNRTATDISAARAGSCSSCAAPTPRAAAGASSASRPRTTRRGTGVHGSSLT